MIPLVILAIVIVDFVLANIPGPVPSSQAIYNVEHDPSFLSLTASTVFNGTTLRGTYVYGGYTNKPVFGCGGPHSPLSVLLQSFNPFHEYTTTTLLYGVNYYGTRPDGSQTGMHLTLFLEVNPAIGQIYNVHQRAYVCT